MKKKIIELSIQFSIVTQFTSFVAIEEREVCIQYMFQTTSYILKETTSYILSLLLVFSTIGGSLKGQWG